MDAVVESDTAVQGILKLNCIRVVVSIYKVESSLTVVYGRTTVVDFPLRISNIVAYGTRTVLGLYYAYEA